MNNGQIILNGFVYTDSTSHEQCETPQVSEYLLLDRATTAICVEDFSDKVLVAVGSALWREAYSYKANQREFEQMEVGVTIKCLHLNYSKTHRLTAKYVSDIKELGQNIFNTASSFNVTLRLSLYQAIFKSMHYRNERY